MEWPEHIPDRDRMCDLHIGIYLLDGTEGHRETGTDTGHSRLPPIPINTLVSFSLPWDIVLYK